jgi:hypothetical protein
MSNYINEKTKDVLGHPDHIALICGDFNINALKESTESTEYILSYNEKNSEFLKEAEQEY